MSNEGYDFESDGWMNLEQIDEDDEALDLAVDAFEKAIKAGNMGGYYGLVSANQDLPLETQIAYLKKASETGRLDAMWELTMTLEDNIEQYAWLSIIVDKNFMADAEEELNTVKEEMSDEEINKANSLKKDILSKIQNSGYEFGTGANPYL